jgi:hypothetical protein
MSEKGDKKRNFDSKAAMKKQAKAILAAANLKSPSGSQKDSTKSNLENSEGVQNFDESQNSAEDQESQHGDENSVETNNDLNSPREEGEGDDDFEPRHIFLEREFGLTVPVADYNGYSDRALSRRKDSLDVVDFDKFIASQYAAYDLYLKNQSPSRGSAKKVPETSSGSQKADLEQGDSVTGAGSKPAGTAAKPHHSSSSSAPSRTMMVASAPQLKKLTFEAVNKFCDSLDSYVRDEQDVSWVSWIDRHLQMSLSQKFVAQDLVTEGKPEAWKDWSLDTFSQNLRLQYPDLTVKTTASNPLEVQLAHIKGGHLTVYNSEEVTEYISKINRVYVNCASKDTDESIAVNVLLKNLLAPYRSSSNRTVKASKTAVNLNRLLQGANKPKTIMSYCVAIQRASDRGVNAINEARLWVDMPISKAYDAPPEYSSDSEPEMPNKKAKGDTGKPRDKTPLVKDLTGKAPFWCYGCGHKNYTRDKCPLCAGHPDRNTARCEWRKSAVYLKHSVIKGRNFILPLHTRADGTSLTREERKKMEELKKPLLANLKGSKESAVAKEDGEDSDDYSQGNFDQAILKPNVDMFDCFVLDKIMILVELIPKM